MLLRPTHSLLAAEFIHQDLTTIQSQSTTLKVTLPHSHFTVTPTSVSHVSFTLQLRENLIPCLNSLRAGV